MSFADTLPDRIGRLPAGAVVVYALVTVAVHLFLTRLVLLDARRRNRPGGPGTFLGGEFLWTAITLLSGLIGFIAYRLIHRPVNGRDDGAHR